MNTKSCYVDLKYTKVLKPLFAHRILKPPLSASELNGGEGSHWERMCTVSKECGWKLMFSNEKPSEKNHTGVMGG